LACFRIAFSSARSSDLLRFMGSSFEKSLGAERLPDAEGN
jgi:hypothetical protein